MRGSRRTRLTLVLLLLTAFTLTALDYNSAQSGPLAALRRGIDTVFGPVQRAVGGAASSVGDALGGLPRLGSYQSKNKDLQKQVDALKGQLAAQSGVQCELDQFRAITHFVDFTGYPVVGARVTGVGASSDFEHTATIDVGSIDGIKPNQTVVTGYGLVGRTLAVYPRTSTVLLLNDPTLSVGGTLVGAGGFGLLTGTGKSTLPFVFQGNEKVNKGTVVVTIGTDTYVPGVPIGTVSTTQKDPNETRTATVIPFVDVNHLGQVGVIVQKDRTEARGQFLPRAPGASPTSSPCAAAVPNGPVPTFSPTPSPTPHVTITPSPTTTPSKSP